MNDTRLNNTTLFLLPMSGLGWDELAGIGLKQCYLDDHVYENDYKNCLFLLFEPVIAENFEHYLIHYLRKKPNYVVDYKVDEFSKMVVIKIPHQYVDDVKWFKKGKLSKISPQYMKTYFKEEDIRFLAYSGNQAYKSILENEIGEKIPEGQDLWSIPTASEEIFRYNDDSFKKKGWL